jgi:hypothetical protein
MGQKGVELRAGLSAMLARKTANFPGVRSVNCGYARAAHRPHRAGMCIRDVAAADQADGYIHAVSIMCTPIFPATRAQENEL